MSEKSFYFHFLFIAAADKEEIEIFTREIKRRWGTTSTDLRYIHSLLEEVLSHWKKWNENYNPLHAYLEEGLKLLYDEESFEASKIEHFHDVSEWKNKYVMLQETAAFLAATCEPNTSEDLRKKSEDLTMKWNGTLLND